jgi:hypothetical protein
MFSSVGMITETGVSPIILSEHPDI